MTVTEAVRDCHAQGCRSVLTWIVLVSKKLWEIRVGDKFPTRDFFVFNITNITNAAYYCRSMSFGGDIMVILVILKGCF